MKGGYFELYRNGIPPVAFGAHLTHGKGYSSFAAPRAAAEYAAELAQLAGIRGSKPFPVR
jgi:hypothetical protein